MVHISRMSKSRSQQLRFQNATHKIITGTTRRRVFILSVYYLNINLVIQYNYAPVFKLSRSKCSKIYIKLYRLIFPAASFS